jgi:Flp pilus assembly protein TadG
MRHDSSRSRRGAALVLLTTMVATVLIPMVGLAIDGAILFLIKVKFTAATDAAALAGARSLSSGMDLVSQKANAEATANHFFAANFPAGIWNTSGVHVTSTAAESGSRTRTVTVGGTVQSPLYFMRILGRSTQTIASLSQASRRDVNLVLVLDRSSSMGGAMGPMLNAARTFVGKFAEARDNVGLIVFGGSAVVAFPSPSPNGPESNFKSASPSVDTLISQTVNGGNTGMAQAVWLAYLELVKRNQPGALNLIVLFTDGLPNGIVANYNDPDPADNFLVAGRCAHRLDAAYPMLGFISQTSGFAATGNTNGIKKIDASTVSSVDESRLGGPTNDGCSFATAETNVRNDLSRFPPTD